MFGATEKKGKKLKWCIFLREKKEMTISKINRPYLKSIKIQYGYINYTFIKSRSDPILY